MYIQFNMFKVNKSSPKNKEQNVTQGQQTLQ